MELSQEERHRLKIRIGEMLLGEPITDAEIENLAASSPAAFYLIASRELGILTEASAEEILQALPDDLLEDLQARFRDFLETSDPLKPDTWDPEILLLTERLILDGRSAENSTKEEMRQALFELMSLIYIEWERRGG